MRDWKKWILGLLLMGFLAVLGLFVYEGYFQDQWHGERVVEAVEAYRVEHGALPDVEDQEVMLGLGFELTEGWYPDFQVLEGGEYRLVFLKGFDGPYLIYDSRKRVWFEGF